MAAVEVRRVKLQGCRQTHRYRQVLTDGHADVRTDRSSLRWVSESVSQSVSQWLTMIYGWSADLRPTLNADRVVINTNRWRSKIYCLNVFFMFDWSWVWKRFCSYRSHRRLFGGRIHLPRSGHRCSFHAPQVDEREEGTAREKQRVQRQNGPNRVKSNINLSFLNIVIEN